MTGDATEYDVFSRTCPSRAALEVVANRWGILALRALADGTMRFNELRRRVDGVSQKMLAQALHALERDGLVDRRMHTAFPLRVDYSLTPLGRATADQVAALVQLVENHMPQVLAAQRTYDATR